LLLAGVTGLFWLMLRRLSLWRYGRALSALAWIVTLPGACTRLSAQTASRSRIYPLNDQFVGGNNVLLYAVTSDLNAAGPVDFEYSFDAATWVTMPQQQAPAFEPASFTTSIDATAFPAGTLFYARVSTLIPPAPW
jgi:hypothetical protein